MQLKQGIYIWSNRIYRRLIGKIAQDYYRHSDSALRDSVLLLQDITDQLSTKPSNKLSIILEPPSMWLGVKKDIYIKLSNKFNSVSATILSRGGFEDKEIELFEKNLPHSKGTFLDVGANVGLYSIIASKREYGLKIHAFEPVPETITELKANIAYNKMQRRIKINQMAVTEKPGRTYITTNFHASNHLTGKDSLENKVEVKSISVDDYVKKAKLTSVEVIKIDIEGQELPALRGAEEVLRKFSPIVFVEIFEQKVLFNDRQFFSPKETINFMLGFGYKFVVIGDQGEIISMRQFKNKKFHKSFHNYIFFKGKIVT